MAIRVPSYIYEVSNNLLSSLEVSLIVDNKDIKPLIYQLNTGILMLEEPKSVLNKKDNTIADKMRTLAHNSRVKGILQEIELLANNGGYSLTIASNHEVTKELIKEGFIIELFNTTTKISW